MPHYVVNSCNTSRKVCIFSLGLSKDRDAVDETHVIKLIAAVGVLTAVFLVLANLQTKADTLTLPCRREHPQQSVDKDIEWPSCGVVMLSCATPACPCLVLVNGVGGYVLAEVEIGGLYCKCLCFCG